MNSSKKMLKHEILDPFYYFYNGSNKQTKIIRKITNSSRGGKYKNANDMPTAFHW